MRKRDTELGQMMLAARMRKGYSMEYLGKLLGVGANHLSRVEQGKKKPSRKLLTNMASVTDVELSELLLAAGYGPTSEDDDVERFGMLQDLWLILDKEQRLAALKAVKRISMGHICREWEEATE